MILIDRTEKENDPLYQELMAKNNIRQTDFLLSIIDIAIRANHKKISHEIIKALNFHCIACLDPYAGEYRPVTVDIQDSPYLPPHPNQIQHLMDDFVDKVNNDLEAGKNMIQLASYVLWRLNHIHPFINGNGRTARAICYFVLCLSIGKLIPGNILLPELIKNNREKYVSALRLADISYQKGKLNLSNLCILILSLVKEQLRNALESFQSKSETK